MPVKVPNNLPAVQVLRDENIFVMTEERATAQDIRPLRIAILNLMPTKEVTEAQLLRVIGNTPLQVEVTLLRTATHQSRNTSSTHLASFYQTFEDVREEKFDGLVIRSSIGRKSTCFPRCISAGRRRRACIIIMASANIRCGKSALACSSTGCFYPTIR